MSTPEGEVKAAIKKVLNKFVEVWWFMPVMGMGGVSGIHDFIICANGHFFSIEAKPIGGKPTALQDLVARGIKAANGATLLIRGVHEMDVLESYLLMFGCTYKDATTPQQSTCHTRSRP